MMCLPIVNQLRHIVKQANVMEEENPKEQKPLKSDTDFVIE